MQKKSERIRVDVSNQAVMVTLLDEKILDDDSIMEIEEQMQEVLKGRDSVKLIVNFCNVEFLTSGFLGFLIRIKKQIDDNGGQLRLCSVNEKISSIFKITRLEKVFDIQPDASKALNSFD